MGTVGPTVHCHFESIGVPGSAGGCEDQYLGPLLGRAGWEEPPEYYTVAGVGVLRPPPSEMFL